MEKPGHLGNKLRVLLLAASETHLDPRMKALVKKWSDPPTAAEILAVLDQCIYSSLASGIAVATMQMTLDITLMEEGATIEEVAALVRKGGIYED